MTRPICTVFIAIRPGAPEAAVPCMTADERDALVREYRDKDCCVRVVNEVNSYLITSPNGNQGTSDLNAAAVEMYRTGAYAAAGWTVELLGPSRIQIISDDDGEE